MGLSMEYGYDIDYLDPDEGFYDDELDYEDEGYQPDPAYEQKMDALLDYLARDVEQARAEEEHAFWNGRREELLELQERYPALRDRAQLDQIDQRAQALAEEAGYPDPTHPEIVRRAAEAVEQANAPSAEDQTWGAIAAANTNPWAEQDGRTQDEQVSEAVAATKAKREAGDYGEPQAPASPDIAAELDAAFSTGGDPLAPPPKPDLGERVDALAGEVRALREPQPEPGS